VKIYTMEQASTDWFAMRKGIPTASNFDRIITPVRCELSSQADDYCAELIGDKYGQFLPPGAENQTSNPAIRWGQQTEEEARRWFTLETGHNIQEVGCVVTDDGTAACSPDGLILAKGIQPIPRPSQWYAGCAEDQEVKKMMDGGAIVGGLELKAPMAKTHVGYLLDNDRLLMQYRCQVHGALYICQLPYWNLVSYAPGLDPINLRIEPSEFTTDLRIALARFNLRYAAALERIKKGDNGGQQNSSLFFTRRVSIDSTMGQRPEDQKGW
jgi:YqaJ-like viral recombinase domain